MPSTSYATPMPAINLRSLLEDSSSRGVNPNIDLEWEPFQAHVTSFLHAIDGYMKKGKTEIANQATNHVNNVRQLDADKEEMERRIQLERDREREMLQNLEQERQTLNDLTSSLAHLQSNLSRIREKSTTLDSELVASQKDLRVKREEQDRQRRILDEMKSRDDDELKGLEEAIGLRIDGVEDDVLLLRFTLIDPSDPEREFSLLLDISGQEYNVTRCSPSLSNLPDVLSDLNTNRHFFDFIRNVRKAFRATVERPAPTSQFDGLAGPVARTPSHRRVQSITMEAA